MKRTSLLTEAVMIGLLLLPFVYLAVIWSQLPAMLPGHYGPGGQPDRYDPKELLAGGLAASSIFLYLLLRFVPRLDPRAGLNTELYQKIRWLITLFWSVFLTWFWTVSWRGGAPDTLVNSVLIGVGLLIASLGNLLNSVKPNYFVGIRTPWTLESPTVWRRTHQLAARLFVTTGFVLVLLVWLLPQPVKFPVIFGLMAVAVMVPVVYSYIYFRQERARL